MRDAHVSRADRRDPTRPALAPAPLPLGRIAAFAVTAFLIGMVAGRIYDGLGLPKGAIPLRDVTPLIELFRLAPVVLAYWLLVRTIENRRIDELAPRKAVPHVLAGIVGGAALFSLVVGALWALGAFVVDGVNHDVPWLGPVLVLGVGAGVGEEIVSRGVIFRIVEEGLGTWAALLLSAAVFGGLHAWNPNATAWSALAIAIEAGLLFGLLYHVTRSLWVCMGMHATWNVAQGPIYGIPVSGFEQHGLLALAHARARLAHRRGLRRRSIRGGAGPVFGRHGGVPGDRPAPWHAGSTAMAPESCASRPSYPDNVMNRGETPFPSFLGRPMPSTEKKYSWLANQPLQRKIVLAIGLLLILFVAVGISNLASLGQEDESREWSSHTYMVLLTLAEVSDDAQTRQAGARGYMLSQSEDEYADFEAADRELERDMANLRQQTADNPLQQSRIDRLQEMLDRWKREVLTVGLEPMRAIGDAATPEGIAAREAIRRSYFVQRSVLMDDIRNHMHEMAETERTLLTKRNAALDAEIKAIRYVDIASLVLCVIIGGLVIAMTFRLITRPIVRMTGLMTRLASHDHSIEVRQLERKDEIGEIARALQVFKEMAIETAGQTWLKSTATNISNRLQATTSYREFADTLLSELVPNLKAGLGVFYVFREETGRLELLGSYGYKQRRHLTVDYALGEGLVGQAATERRTIVLQDVPEDYTRIHSGSGEAPPRSVVVVPVLLRDTLLGVIEIASFAHLTDVQERLLDELTPIVALSLENLARALRTRALLEQTQSQADELRASEEALRSQQEDLRSTNEELKAKTAELQEQSQRLVASEEELRVQTEELHASNEELREKSITLNQQKDALEALQRETQEKAEELRACKPVQIRLPRQHVARTAHAVEQPADPLTQPGRQRRRKPQRRTGRVRPDHPRCGVQPAAPDQRHPRSIQGRGRKDGTGGGTTAPGRPRTHAWAHLQPRGPGEEARLRDPSRSRSSVHDTYR